MKARLGLFRYQATKAQRLALLAQIFAAQKYMLCEEALTPAFCFSDAGLKKKALFKITHKYSLLNINLGDWNKLDYVATGICLRTIPSFSTSAAKNCDDLKRDIYKLTGRPLGLVVPVVEHFELFAKTSIKPQHWLEAGVAHFHLPMADFTAEVHTDALLAAIFVMNEYIKKGHCIVIHCKAGRSRSASVVLAYLMVFGDIEGGLQPGQDLNTVLEYMVSHRKQVDLSGEKKQKSLDTVLRINQEDWPAEKRTFKIDPMNPVPVFKSFLSSLELKNGLAQSLSLKMMGGYYSRHPNSDRAESLLAFTTDILKAKDDEWYVNYLLKRNEPLNAFLNANKIPSLDDWKKRKELVDIFELELNELMRVTFNCTQAELKQYKEAYTAQLLEPSMTTTCDQELKEIKKRIGI